MRAKPWSAGDRFGRLTVIGPESRLSVRNHRAVLCRCECGNEKIIALNKLRSGYTKSCGCLQKEAARESVSVAHQAKTGKRYDFKPETDLGDEGLHKRLKRDRGMATDYPCTYANGTCRGRMEWANISHRYLGVYDFMPLCKSHHARYDRIIKNMRQPWG